MKKVFNKNNLKFYGGIILGGGILMHTLFSDGYRTGRNNVLDVMIEDGATVMNGKGEFVDLVAWRNS